MEAICCCKDDAADAQLAMVAGIGAGELADGLAGADLRYSTGALQGGCAADGDHEAGLGWAAHCSCPAGIPEHCQQGGQQLALAGRLQ